MLPRINGYMKQYQSKIQAESTLSKLQHQVEESTSIEFTSMPDLELNSMIVYESPTVNTTELINMVLPVLEDQKLQADLAEVAKYVGEGLLDPALAENLTRSIVSKGTISAPANHTASIRDFFESALHKYSIREVLK
jgi:hypothetical protein